MTRFALGLEYNGSGFHGWQTQAGLPCVQAALEAALSKIANEKITTHCAGRTDAGVHALLQVVHFDTSASRPRTAWVRGVNSHLPPAISVLWAKPVSDNFHARYAAYGRAYRYVLLNRAERPGLWQGRVGWTHDVLDVTAMNTAAEMLLGTHDFSAFRAAECQAKTPTRTMYNASVIQQGDFVQFDFAANAFLQHMVRNLVGSLVFVGKGKCPPKWMAELLALRDRKWAAPTFSPDGLYFCGPSYAPHL